MNLSFVMNYNYNARFCLHFRVIEEYMTEKVQFVVTSEGWHDSFEDVS